jgi:pSer/pThr/pTyr-binding forkhead associated (FHA) protein
VENFAKALTYYLEPAEGTSKEEFINTFAYPVLVEKSGMVSLDNSPLLSSTEIRNDIRDALHPITDSSESISNNAKVFELRKRLNSQATDIFVGRAPTNDVVLADPVVSKSHFRFISIPGTNHLHLADMFSTKGTYLNGKKIDPFEKYQVEDHDEISFGTEYQLVYYSPQGFYEMLIGLKDNESKDGEQKQAADDDLALLLESKDGEQKQAADDDLALLLDTIEKETTDLTEAVLVEESLLDDMAPSGEDDLASLDSGVLEGDDFELDHEALDDSARASTEIETKEQDSGTKLDNQGEDEQMLTENEVVSSKDDAAMTDTSEDGAIQGTDKKLTGPAATTPELETTRAFDDAMGKEQATEAFPAIDDQLSEDPFSDYELVNEVEEKGGEGEQPNLNALADELGVLLNERMEAIVTRLVEERMPAIVEPIILQTIKKLLKSRE